MQWLYKKQAKLCLTPFVLSASNAGWEEGFCLQKNVICWPKLQWCAMDSIVMCENTSLVTSILANYSDQKATIVTPKNWCAGMKNDEKVAICPLWMTTNAIHTAVLSFCVFRDQVDTIATAIVEASRTGEVGDGKIFVYPVADVIRMWVGQEEMLVPITWLLSSVCPTT